MKQSEAQKRRQQQLAALLPIPVPEPLTPREEAIQILAEGLLELIIQRSRQAKDQRPTRKHWLRVQTRNEN